MAIGCDSSPVSLEMTLILLLSVLVLAYGYFVVAGIAVRRSRNSRLKELLAKGYFGSECAQRVMVRPDHFFLTAQIGVFWSLIAVGICLAELARAWARCPLLETAWLPGWFAGACLLLLGMVVVLMVLQQLKAFVLARPTRTLCYLSPVLLLCSKVLYPFAYLARNGLSGLLRALGVHVSSGRELSVSVEEVKELVAYSGRVGQIDERESLMIQRAFVFSETVVREVMTPRKDVITIDESASLAEVVELLMRERLTRVVVVGRDLDDVKGILVAKDLLPFVGSPSREFSLQRIMRPAFFLSSAMHLDDALNELKNGAVHFAVVLDEHGGVDGVVTLEDLVEEIVGDIFDEFDSPLEEMEVLKTKSGELLVDGSALVDDLNGTHQLHIQTGEYDTIAGFLLAQMGRIPMAGEEIECDGVLYRIEETEQNRVTRVRVIPLPK